MTAYPIWVAHYTTKPKPAVPPGWQNWTFWQFSETGKVTGITTPVDLDRFNGTLDQLRALGAPGAGGPPGTNASPPSAR